MDRKYRPAVTLSTLGVVWKEAALIGVKVSAMLRKLEPSTAFFVADDPVEVADEAAEDAVPGVAVSRHARATRASFNMVTASLSKLDVTARISL